MSLVLFLTRFFVSPKNSYDTAFVCFYKMYIFLMAIFFLNTNHFGIWYICTISDAVTNDEFLKTTPTDLHLRRLSLLYGTFGAKELAIHLGLSDREVETVLENEDPMTSNFEILRKCRDSKMVTFEGIKKALQRIGKESIHILCKVNIFEWIITFSNTVCIITKFCLLSYVL